MTQAALELRATPQLHFLRTRLTGANPTIVSYNAVKIYNAAISLVRFEKIFSFEKRSSLLPKYNDGVVWRAAVAQR
jgi:hypothetical protein